MAEERVQRRLAAILAADVVGFSRMMEADESGTLAALKRRRKDVLEPLVAKHQGRVFKVTGDGVLVEFASAVNAVQCAVDLQRDMADANSNQSNAHQIVLRIGINLGDIVVEGGDLYGDGVNVAARLEALAEPGQICVTRTIAEQVKHKLALQFESLGEHRVKNIMEPVWVYRVMLDEMPKSRRSLKRLTAMPGRRIVIAGGAFGLSIAVGAWVWNNYWHESNCLRLPDKPSIAVLPFDYIGDDPKLMRLAYGIPEYVTANLQRSGDLFVIESNSAQSYKGGGVDVRQVGCDLGVKYVLDGSIQGQDERILITPKLIEAANRGLLWSIPFDGAPQEIFLIQQDLTANVAGQLLGYENGLSEDGKRNLQRKPPTDNLEAYDFYLRAETLGRGWTLTSERAEALALYEKAIGLDPKFSDAYAGYARIVTDAWLYQIDDLKPIPVARKEAYEMASTALTLDIENPRPYSILSALQSADGWHDQAIETARKAISLQPNSAEAYDYLASALIIAGRHAEALEAMETALRRDPRPSPQFRADFGWVLFYNQQYERALEQLEKASDAGVTYLEILAAVYVKLGRPAEAQATTRRLLEMAGAFNLEFFRVQNAHYRRNEDLDQLIDALRTAGVPEWPYRYQGRAENRLNDQEIASITFGRNWTGSRDDDRPFVQEIGKDGTLAYRDSSSLVIGVISIEVGKLCQKSEAFLMGRKHCGYLYKNPDGKRETADEYIYVSPYAIYRFSVNQ